MNEELKLPHSVFKIGTAKGMIWFQILDTDKFSKLVHQSYIQTIKSVITILGFALYIAIPILALVLGKWILLLGFLGCFFGLVMQKFCIGSPKQNVRINRSIILSICFGVTILLMIYYFGILYPLSFILVCAFYEFIGAILLSYFWIETGINSLINNENNYNYCIDNNIIKVFPHLPTN